MDEKKPMDIRDLIKSFDSMHLSTLQRAALISPQIKGRTIGPDIEPYYDENGKTIEPPPSNGNAARDHAVAQVKIDKLPERTAARQQNGLNSQIPDRNNNESSATAARTPNANNVKNGRTSALLPLQSLSPQELMENLRRRELKREYLKEKRQYMREKQEYLANAFEEIREANRPDPAELERFVEDHNREFEKMVAEAEAYAAQDAAKRQARYAAIKQSSEQRMKMFAMKTVLNMQEKFRPKYEETVRLLLSEKHRLQNGGEYNKVLQDLVQLFETIIQRLKNDDCGQNEVMIAANLCTSLEKLRKSICAEVESIIKNEKYEALRKQQEQEQLAQQQKIEKEKRDAEAAAAQAQAAANVAVAAAAAAEAAAASAAATAAAQPTQPTTQATNMLTEFVAPERVQFYESIIAFYHEKVESVKPLQAIEAMKKWRTLCQRAINIPINAIAPQSPQFLQDKFEKLYSWLAGQPYRGADNQTICITDHQLGRDYCLLLMAKKFVNQGETAISSNPQQAFAVATIVVSLWKHVPDFGILFLAYLFKESPLLAPYFVLRRPDQPYEDYMKFLGYRYPEGKMEDYEGFLKRQAGMARLYAAVMVTNGRKQDGGQHPFGLNQGWAWIVNFVRVPPFPGISSTLLVEVLQTIGADMWATYREQFVKFITAVQQEYFPQLAAVDTGGPLARLELLLNNFLRDGQLPRPQGMIPDGFW